MANGLVNARDIGGLRVAGGGTIRPGLLLRGDAPHHGDEDPGLDGWPPAHVIDLRSSGETGPAGHPLDGPHTTVHHLPMFSRANPLRMAEEDEVLTVTLDDIYTDLVRVVAPFVDRVARLVGCGDGAVFVHCSAGKDRTGVLVATTLAAVGVEREEIVADYVRSDPHAGAIIERIVANAPPEHRPAVRDLLEVRHAHLMHASADVIERVLDRLAAAPGGAAGHLTAAGVDDATLAALRERLIA